jgi:uncharacterized protein HemX
MKDNIMLYAVIILLIAIIAVGGFSFYQSHKITTLNQTISNQKTENKSLTEELGKCKTSIKDRNEEIKKQSDTSKDKDKQIKDLQTKIDKQDNNFNNNINVDKAKKAPQNCLEAKNYLKQMLETY